MTGLLREGGADAVTLLTVTARRSLPQAQIDWCQLRIATIRSANRKPAARSDRRSGSA